MEPTAAVDVSTHYDHVKNTTKSARKKGLLYALKTYHNDVKRDLLHIYAMYAPSVLDIGCGRGGDMQKWRDCRISRVDAYDISPVEIEEAQRRYGFLQAPGCTYTFSVADFSKPVTLGLEQYHVATAMFCLHYFFASDEILTTFLTTVASALVDGGVFIGCCLNSRRVQDYVRSDTRTDVLTISPGENFWNESGCGREYTFALTDTVTSKNDVSEGSTEYLVDMELLIATSKSLGLHFKECVPFIPPTQFPGYEASAMCQTFAFIKY